MEAEPLERMAGLWLAFDEGLRMHHDFNEEVYASLKGALRECAEAWAMLDSIPRLGANILVDIFPSTEANANLYEGELAGRVTEAAYELHGLVGECVALR